MRPGGRLVRSGVFGPLPNFLEVVGVVLVRSVYSRAPWGASGSFASVRSVRVRLRGRRVRSGVFAPFPYALAVVSVYSVHSRATWGSLGAFGPFPCDLGVVVFVRVHSVHSVPS